MSGFEELIAQTSAARERFIGIPLIQEALRDGTPKPVYFDFLGQAYHHVKHTVPLLALAVARCGPEQAMLQSELIEYIVEERGHEQWILEDIEALGGDAEAVRLAQPRSPCRIMVGHAYYLIESVCPFALLGMIHVLEGMSVALAHDAVVALRKRIGPISAGGFKYLTTHSELDVGHAGLFERLLNRIEAAHLLVVIEAARDFYGLYGDIFRDIDARREHTAAVARMQ